MVRLTDDAGGSTLYFHDNAFSPQGETMMFNTPNGIAIIGVAKIGTDGARADVVTPPARGGYFSRRAREIYYNGDAGTVAAVDVDKRTTRDVAHARSEVLRHFWIAGVSMETGRHTRYHVQRDWWGVHFNSSRDDTLFASDGGDASQVAYATDGTWINLLRVQPNGMVTRESWATCPGTTT